MKRKKWHLALIITSLILSAGMVGGCMPTASPEGNVSQPPPTPSAGASDAAAPSQTATDTTAASDTAATTPSDETLIGSDPVSGRSQEIDLSWEDFCLSSQYQVQIAKDPGFTIIVVDTGAFTPASTESPAVYYPAGGRAPSASALTPWANLESGHTYYWRVRVRQAATGQVLRSPWSEVKSYTVGSGFPASSPSYGLQSLYPNNGRSNCPVKPASFAWSPFKDTTKYRFVLADDAAMTQVVKDTEVATTAYEYDGELEHGEGYFWRVMALEPVQSDWSATFSFQTGAAPLPPALEPEPNRTPLWAWVIIAIGTALLIVIIFLIFRVRRS